MSEPTKKAVQAPSQENGSLTYESLKEKLEGKPDGYLNTILQEEFVKDPELQKMAIDKPDEFVAKYLTEPVDGDPPADPPPADPPADPPVDPPVDPPPTDPPVEDPLADPPPVVEPPKEGQPGEEEVEVTFKVKPAWLGEYVKNSKDVSEAALKAIQGNANKDNYIHFLKDEKGQVDESLATTEADLQTTRTALEQVKTAQAAVAPAFDPAKGPAAAGTGQPIELPIFGKDDDIVTDPDAYQEKVTKFVTGAAQIMETLQADNKAMKEQIAGVDKTVETAVEKVTSRLKPEGGNEFDEADSLRKAFNGKGINFARPTKEIESDYVQFMKDLKSVSGIATPLYAPLLDGTTGKQQVDASGNLLFDPTKFSTELSTAYTKFNDKVRGEELRKQCEVKGVALPSDFQDLLDIYEIKNIRYQIMTETGGSKPASYERAFRDFVKNPDNVSDLKVKLATEQKVKEQAAIAARGTKAVEADGDHSADPVDLTKITKESFDELMAKTNKTDEEKGTLRKIMEACHKKDTNIFPPDEVEALLASPVIT